VCSRDRADTATEVSVRSGGVRGASTQVSAEADVEGTSPSSEARLREVETRSFAVYRQGVLRSCGDYSLAVTSAEGAATAFTPRQWEADMYPGTGSKTVGKTLLTHSCDQQFRDRTVLAACAYRVGESDDAGSSAEIRGHLRYYGLAALEPGSPFRKQCLELGGDWRELPSDSDEVRRTRARDALGDLRSLSETLSR
jgi:hypothetical protein